MSHRHRMTRLLVAVACLTVSLFGWVWPGGPTQAQAPLANPAIIQLTSDPAIDVRPAWSPDNRQIAFQSNRGSDTFHIYIMNADGSNQRALTSGSGDDRHPVWTPDGKSILYDSTTGAERDIWIVNVADGSRKQLSHSGGLANFAAPSSDGQRLLFYVYKNDTLDLWTSRIDGSEPHQLTNQLARAQNNQCTFACHQAAWSADGQTIAYPRPAVDSESIWLMRSDGSDARAVVDTGERNHFPWFLSDGRLAFITEHVSPMQSWTDVRALDLKTGNIAPLFEQMSPQGPFEWSADNRKVLFHSPRAGDFNIYLIDLTAPGGIAALQGTPAPVQLAPATTAVPAPAVAPAPAPTAQAADNNSATGVWVAAIAAAAVVLGALALMLRARSAR